MTEPRTPAGNDGRADAPLQRILLIDDDADIRLVARLALETGGGFCVRTCGRGVDATAAAADFAPQLILLDVMMPGMDGPATLRALRATPTGAVVPVVLMTAKAGPRDRASLRDCDAVDLIAKPFDPATLAERVLAIWRHHGA